MLGDRRSLETLSVPKFDFPESQRDNESVL